MTATFEKTYFVASKTSNYQDYRKKRFEQQAKDLDGLFHSFNLQPDRAHIIDFGCATGALMRELKKLGYMNLLGTDISQWAIDFGIANYDLKSELQYYNRNLLRQKVDVILFLDVLEHIPEYETEFLLKIIRQAKSTYIICRIPVSKLETEDFVLPVSRNDKTHITCHCKSWWQLLFMRYGYTLIGVINGTAIYESEGVMCGVFRCQE